jgi:sterol 3beta-glucosyltransferase
MLDQDDGERVARVAIEALGLAGKRGILSGFGTLKNLPGNIIAVDAVPHSWLFPKMAAVCHHGGAGTSAAGFKAGVPSVIVPFALDQFAWATRSYELGIGSEPLPFKKINAKNLSLAIMNATKPEICEAAANIGRLMISETGAGDSVQVIASALESTAARKAGIPQ